MSRGPLALKIAWRYMRAPKSHGAVNAISIISVVGVAVATAAIIVVLSVFNGFRFHLNNRLDNLTSDVSIQPSYGKVIENGDSLAQALGENPDVAEAMAELSDNALVIAWAKEMPIKLKGVTPDAYARITSMDSLILDGAPVSLYSPRQAAVSVGVAQRLGLQSAGDTLFIFAPKRQGRVNLANPIASFLTDSLQVASIFRSMQTEIDENTVISDIETVRELFQYDTEATSVELKLKPGVDPTGFTQALQNSLGDGYIVKDRMMQQEVNFRMVAIEKWITFLLLTFILLIASFNIISTLCMLILDKGHNLNTLSHLGLSRRRIGNIFWWESILVTISGALSGIVIGVLVCYLQEKYGLLKLAGDPNSLILQAYPVRLEWLDIAVTMVPVAIIGIITAWISHSFARSKVKAI